MYAKKSLGQNFLTSAAALQKIITAGTVSVGDVVLEIGPGRGALTEYLLRAGATVIAVEKDVDLIPILESKFSAEITTGTFVLLREDITNFIPEQCIHLSKKYKLIANIPYYITGEIIKKFLSSKHQPEKMVLLVQKEVADRIVAKDGKESVLSIAVKAYCSPKFIGVVKAGSFVPAPKVDSAIVLFDSISKKFFTAHNIDEKTFFEVIKTGFAHKRKRLFSNLKEKFVLDEDVIINQKGLTKNVRAEQLSIGQWASITKIISLD